MSSRQVRSHRAAKGFAAVIIASSLFGYIPCSVAANTSQTATSTPSPITDFSCDADASLRYVQGGLEGTDVLKPASNVNLKLEYVAKPPSKLKITLKSYSAPDLPSTDIFASNVGMVFLLVNQRLTVTLPKGLPSTVDVSRAVDRNNLGLTHGDLEFPFVSALVEDALDARSRQWETAKRVGTKKIDGKDFTLVEVENQQDPRGSATKVRRAIDPNLHTPVEEEAIDNTGKVVSRTTFNDYKQDASGKWVALMSTTVIAPRREVIAFPRQAAQGQKEAILSGRILLKGRTITRTYALAENKYFVLSSVNITDDEGNAVLDARFSNYHINQGISDSLFIASSR